LRFLRSLGPFLVPPLYLALILWLQPSDHLGSAPDKAPWLSRSVYDDWDLTAMALRGLNASLGRTAGRIDNPDQLPDEEYARGLDEPRSLQPRYYLEYPHPTLLLFRLPYWLEPLPQPPVAVCDGGYGNIVEHLPRNDSERQLWRHFRRITRTYLALLCLGTLLLMAVLRIGYEPGGGLSGPVVLLVLPGALYFSLNRFDVVLALLTALGFACLGRRRYGASGLLFGTATAIKIYPVVLVPLVLLFLWPHRRSAVSWLAGYGGAVAACFLPPLLLSGWQAVWQPFLFQLTRPPLGATAYGYLLPQALEENDLTGRLFRLGTVGLVVLLLAWQRPPDLTSLLRRGAIAVIVFISLPVFYSPQWIVWLLPLLVPLAGQQRPLLWLIVALDVVTYISFPLGNLTLPAAVIIYTRYGILATLVGVLAWAELHRATPPIECFPGMEKK
jgi:Glycosyltransferase family 87